MAEDRIGEAEREGEFVNGDRMFSSFLEGEMGGGGDFAKWVEEKVVGSDGKYFSGIGSRGKFIYINLYE